MSLQTLTHTVPVMVLAAGLGTRLRPITDVMPKPMVPLSNGDTLLGTVFSVLQRAGMNTFAVNTHYCHEQIERYVTARLGDCGHLFYESSLLGTGGPLVAAKSVLATSDCFLVHNGDILMEADFAQIVERHRDEKNMVTMVLVPGPERRVLTDIQGNILDIRGLLEVPPESGSLLTYSGIAVFSTAFFKYLPEKIEAHDVILSVIDAIKAGERVRSIVLSNKNYWSDLGTTEKYIAAATKLPTFFDFPPPFPSVMFSAVAEQGSIRQFFRLQSGDISRILMRSYPEDADFDRFITFGKYLTAADAGTPQIMGYNPHDFTVLMEDLGTQTLFQAVMDANGDEAKIMNLYHIAVDALINFQYKGTISSPEYLDGIRFFNMDYLQWETDYFYENLVKCHFKIELNDDEEAEVNRAFRRLAKRTDAQPKIWMHRDCQSQNIMIGEGRARFVDFQGARLGPFAYDIAALIWDPYLEIPDRVRESALNRYAEKIILLPGCERLTRQVFDCACSDAALQRLMQALGAYAFLSHVRGKKQYLKYIGPAVKNVRRILEKNHDFPIFKDLFAKISE